MTTQEKVLAFQQANPTDSLQDIADVVGVSRQRVHQILQERKVTVACLVCDLPVAEHTFCEGCSISVGGIGHVETGLVKADVIVDIIDEEDEVWHSYKGNLALCSDCLANSFVNPVRISQSDDMKKCEESNVVSQTVSTRWKGVLSSVQTVGV